MKFRFLDEIENIGWIIPSINQEIYTTTCLDATNVLSPMPPS